MEMLPTVLFLSQYLGKLNMTKHISFIAILQNKDWKVERSIKPLVNLSDE
jgi:hypothetical protein